MNMSFLNGVSDAALFEQAAEEAVELAHALLKFARIMRNENPTPTTADAALSAINEECSDMHLCMDILRCRLGGKGMRMGIDTDIIDEKIARWKARIRTP